MKTYWLSVGDSSNAPSLYTGLSPTMSLFVNVGGSNVIGPAISELPAGSGVYQFSYGPSLGMFFSVDWGVSVPASFRYTKGGLDPIQAVDERIGGIINNDDSIGSTSVDPQTVVGFLKRLMNFNEGAAIFEKSSGEWSIYSIGASTLLRVKTLTNTVTEATKD